MSWIVMRVYKSADGTPGGAWVEGCHATEEWAELVAEKGNVQAERYGLPWALEVKEMA